MRGWTRGCAEQVVDGETRARRNAKYPSDLVATPFNDRPDLNTPWVHSPHKFCLLPFPAWRLLLAPKSKRTFAGDFRGSSS